MYILMVTASLPYPPHQGGAIRAYGILHGLYHNGHTVTLLSFDSPARPTIVEGTPLAEYCERVITVPTPERSTRARLRDLLLSSRADIACRLESDDMHRELSGLLDSGAFDLMQFEGIEVAGYLLAARQHYPNLPLIYDAFNAEASLQQTIATIDRQDIRRLPSAVYSQMQAGRVKEWERHICQAATAVIAVSDEDAAILRDLRGDVGVYMVPSGVFAADYTPPDAALSLKPNALVFTGKMDYRPNVDAMLWFGDEVLPQITQYIDATLYIVGQKPHRRLDVLRSNPHIEITGWVPEVQPYLRAADVYVAPLRMGSGTRLKILEAMAAGCALVATPTAAAGLVSAAKEHMLLPETAPQMATMTRDLLQHPSKRVTLGVGAREFIRQHYDWSVLIPRLLDVYRKLGLEKSESVD